MSRPSLYVLDGYSLIYQVYHAIPLMTGPDGQPTNAVFGVFRDLLKLLKDRKPDYLAVALDGPGPVFRSEIYPEYKAQRGPMPEDLQPQIDAIRQVYEGFRVPILIEPRYEADDLIATLARRGAERGLDVFICTADKDARQLIDDRIRIYNVRKDQVIDEAALLADWGVRPNQVVDLLALTGDTVDNVPGVPGIGIKTAAKLLQEFGDLETLLASAGKVKGAKTQQNLRDHAETARLARKLVELQDQLPIPLDWDAMKVGDVDAPALKALCIARGFHRFLDEIVDTAKPVETSWPVSEYRLIDTPEKLAEFAETLGGLTKISFDTETTSVDPLQADVVGYAFAWGNGQAAYVAVRGPVWDSVIEPDRALERLRPILENPAIEKVGQNLKYDLLVLRRIGVELAGPITDTMVLSYLLESGERNHNLDELSRRFLDHTMIPITSLIGKGKNQKTMDQAPVAQVAEYAGEDADAAWRIESILAPRVRDEGLWDLYANLERPLIGVLARMEAAGIKVDQALLRRLSDDFATRIDAIETQIYSLAGKTFNIASGPQLREVLFDTLGLPVLAKTPGGEPSTAAEVLEELASQHEMPRLLMLHRHLSKLKNTYLDTLGPLADAHGRIHTSFGQTVAATGRLSSSDPNLQNIPARTEEGKQIRQAFIPGEPGWSLLTADYSQIELRVLAHYCDDPALVKAFADDRDIHAVVAARIFGVDESAVTDEQRRVAKTVNFGVIYGLSAFGLASRLGISQAEAAQFIAAYFEEYAGVDAFITRTLEQAQKEGRVTTILGRRRAINGIKNTTGRNRNLAERTAVNTVIQGSAADLIKQAMLDVDRRLQEAGLKARMLLQIHDELVFEAPDPEIPALAELVRDAMANALPLKVPVRVDVAAGPNWLDVQEVIFG